MSEPANDTMTREELFATLERMASQVAKVCREERDGRQLEMARVGTVLLAMQVMEQASRDAWLYGKIPTREAKAR